MKDVKIRFFMADAGGSGFYRTILPAKYLKILGFDVKVVTKIEAIDGDTKILVVQRKWQDRDFEFCRRLRDSGAILVYELDDNLWKIPDHIAAQKIYNNENLSRVERFIFNCDGVITTTKPLFEILSRFHNNVRIIPNFVEEYPFVKRQVSRRVKIGFCGSSSHVPHLQKLAPLLATLNAKLPRVELCSMGVSCSEVNLIVSMINPSPPEVYIKNLIELGIDIGLIYIFDDEFNRCRSPLKFLEYAIAGIAPIAPNVVPYSNYIMNGVTGVLIDYNDDWFEKLKEIVHSGFYCEIAERAYQHVFDQWLIKNNVHLWTSFFQELINNDK